MIADTIFSIFQGVVYTAVAGAVMYAIIYNGWWMPLLFVTLALTALWMLLAFPVPTLLLAIFLAICANTSAVRSARTK